MDFISVKGIVVGERVRQDVGDLTALSQSLGERGMLQPIGIDKNNSLVFGFRRLKAAEKLCWDNVPVVVVDKLKDAIDYLKAERDENTCRKPLSKTEAVELGRRLEEIEKPKAAERQKSALNNGKPRSGKLPERENKGETREKVSDAVGMKPRTYEKAKAVVVAAEEKPETFGDLPAKMEAESVDAAHKELKRRKSNEPKDELGIVIPVPLREVFAIREAGAEAIRLFRQLQAIIGKIAQLPGSEFYRRELQFKLKGEQEGYSCPPIKDAQQRLEKSLPHCCVCPYCHHKHAGKVAKDCQSCMGLGWVPVLVFQQSLPADYRESVESLAGKDGGE